MTERILVPNIEKELRFINWRKSNNIDKFLFDLDDTLCGTRDVFIRQMEYCVEFLAGRLEQPKGDLLELLNKTNDKYYHKYSVQPTRWDYVIDEMAVSANIPKNTSSEALKILKQIYETPPVFLPGVQETLDFFKKTDTPMAIVTHANREWTLKKSQWLGLGEYFVWENDIYIVDESGFKTAESWREAARYFRVDPARTAVVGDSPLTDMCAEDAGFNHLFLVGDEANRWSVYNSRPISEKVQKIAMISDICDMGLPYKFDLVAHSY